MSDLKIYQTCLFLSITAIHWSPYAMAVLAETYHPREKNGGNLPLNHCALLNVYLIASCYISTRDLHVTNNKQEENHAMFGGTKMSPHRISESYYNLSNVCLFVCLFVPLLLPGPWADLHQTWREGGGRPRI